MGKLGIYLLADYPSKGLFIEAVRVCQDFNVDFIEIGFPFSDPVADGDVLERASYETLKQHNLDDFIAGLKEAKEIFKGRIYIMTYANIVYSTGVGSFLERVGNVSGIIIADLPLREVRLFEKEFRQRSISLIRFLTPESRIEDIESAIKSADESGFIYFISKRGTTGGDFSLDEETVEKINRAKGKGVDVYVGFGVKDRKDVELVYKVADGAIVGTKAVSELERGIDAFRDFIRDITDNT